MKLSMKDVTVEKAESLVDQIQEVQGPGRVHEKRVIENLVDLLHASSKLDPALYLKATTP